MIASFTSSWLNTLRLIKTAGLPVEVRGSMTRELLADQMSFPMEYPILMCPERNISYSFMYREAWWILTGCNELEFIASHAPSMAKFSDDGIRLSGAYGPKVVDQIGYVVEALGQDPHTRQAVINIWRERPAPSKDIPCTLSAQFTIRDNRLHCFVTMRSSDIWLGVPYDVFTFTMLSLLVAVSYNWRFKQNVELGVMFHTAASRHLYMKNDEKAKACLSVNTSLGENDPGPSVSAKEYCSALPNPRELVTFLYRASIGKRPETLKQKLPWLYL